MFKMISLIRNRNFCFNQIFTRVFSTKDQKTSTTFETVFSFPGVKYVALINRLKVYHIVGSAVILPCSGILGMMNVMSSETFYATAYVGITGAIALSLVTLPLKDVIGHLYISEDNSKIKISSLDYWGRRIDKIIPTEEWVPLMDIQHKLSDAFYLRPQLTDGSTYKLPIKFGIVYNKQKMGNILE